MKRSGNRGLTADEAEATVVGPLTRELKDDAAVDDESGHVAVEATAQLQRIPGLGAKRLRGREATAG